MEVEGLSISEKFDKIMKACFGFENGTNNEDKFFAGTLKEWEELVKDIQKDFLFSPNEEITDIDPRNLKLLLLPYYQAETMYRIMEDRKKSIQISKKFYDEFMKLIDHYALMDELTKRAWKCSINPEEFRSAPKLSPVEERTSKIEELKRRKLIEQKVDKLKDSEEDDDIKEFWMGMINLSIMKSIAAFKSIDMEFQILAYRDSLPEDDRKPSEKPLGQSKPLETFHIPKGGLEGMSYMFSSTGKPEESSGALCDRHKKEVISEMSGKPEEKDDGSIVRTFQETGERIKVDFDSQNINDRAMLREKLKAQVFQPGYGLPTLTLEEFGVREMARMQDRMDKEQALKEEMDAKTDEDLEEMERQRLIQHDNMIDEVPKGYGNTKRL